jgi:hypothetical protein
MIRAVFIILISKIKLNALGKGLVVKYHSNKDQKESSQIKARELKIRNI